MQLRRTTPLLALMIATAGPVHANDSDADAVDLVTSDQKILYALGLSLAERLGEFELTPEELALVRAGLVDGVSGNERLSLGQWSHRIEGMVKRRREEVALRQRKAARDYLRAAQSEPGAVKRASGLIYRELEAGDGPRPGASDRVTVHYRSIDKGRPATFEVQGVIRCWTEALQMMSVGTRAKLVCPPQIAYGRKGMPGRIKPGATLTFEVELLEIVSPASPE
jgi:FKBP-type peptidyl-prolyl cis-trans isomerase FkpA